MTSYERRPESPLGRSRAESGGTLARAGGESAARHPQQTPSLPPPSSTPESPRVRQRGTTVETTVTVLRRLVGEREHRLYVIEPDKVDYIESHGNYVKLHMGNAEYITRDSVKRLSTVLAGSGFVRIERSLLINIRAILYVQRVGRGRYAFTLTSGARLHSGAKYRDEILQALPLAQAPGGRSSQ
jgi:DNA-binding LytR/AlgR family response regulator